MKKRQTAIVKEMKWDQGFSPLRKEERGHFTVIDATELFSRGKAAGESARPLLKIIYLNKSTTNN